MRVTRVFTKILLGTVFALPLPGVAMAADLILSPQPMAEMDTGLTLPAVSGINGKIELSGGLLRIPPTNYGHVRLNGSLSIPVGDRFGLQGDLAAYNTPTGIGVAGAVHAFTRDPDQYLFGVTGAFVRVPGATLFGVGPEAEFYMGDWTLEAWAGFANLNYDDVALADVNGVYAIADVAYYITPDFRVSLGASTVLGYNQLRLATEYQFTSWDFPFSVTGEGRFGQDGTIIATIGLKHYFGDSDKSLIDRHRQDDPPDRAIDFFGAAGSLPYATATPGPTTPTCPDGEIWNSESEICELIPD
ncbi:MAG TPA: hypothetical protein VIN06_11945 [Devosia sp.]